MKTPEVRLLEVKGTMVYGEPMGQERLVRPVDIYPEFRAQPSNGLPPSSPGSRVCSARRIRDATSPHVRPSARPWARIWF
jgi:L-rhamnonate dehydratase